MATGVIQSTDPTLTHLLIMQGANRWNGTTMVAASGVASASFSTGLVALTAVADANSAFMNQYTFTVPSSLPSSASAYQLRAYGGTTVSDFRGDYGEAFWNGTTWGAATVTATSVSVELSNGVASQREDVECARADVHSYTFSFTNDDGSYPNFTGETITMVVSDLANVLMFERTGTVTTEVSTGDSVVFTTAATNTTTDLDAQLSPVRAAAVDKTALKYDVWNETTGRRLAFGAFIVDQNAVSPA